MENVSENLSHQEKQILELDDEGLCECPNCKGKHAHIIVRITGYYSVTSKFNKGKLGEYRARTRTTQDDWKFKKLDN